MDDEAWFEPKRFGFGAGLPVAWQGWALLGGYLAVVIGLSRLLESRPAVLAVCVMPLTAGLLVIVARHTRGGWRWRWGGD